MANSMGIPQTKRSITIEEYLDRETRSEVRHEYIGGQVYVMIDQAKQAVTRFRQENGWKPEHLAGGDALALPSIRFEQSLASI